MTIFSHHHFKLIYSINVLNTNCETKHKNNKCKKTTVLMFKTNKM